MLWACDMVVHQKHDGVFLVKKEKLVRDNIPRIIDEAGKVAHFYTVSGEALYGHLKGKLREEVDEFFVDGALEELADVLEVVHAICKHRGISYQQLEEFRMLKAQTRGSFDQGIVLVLEE
jgi:predicted house-cleaning noncanonical NTP pyrophosphatase (MazG superfamily)